MKRNKYINTFNTTTDFDNYINSAEPGFPNVALTEDDGHVHYTPTSPNSHVFYGELVDATQNIPVITLYNNNSKVNTYTPTVDTLTNEFYIDDWDTIPTFNKLGANFLTNKANIKSIKKFKGLDMSSVTDMMAMFYNCTSLTSVDLSALDTSSVTNMNELFNNCRSLTSIDLSALNTSSVTTTANMFQSCMALKTINLSGCDFSNVIAINNMFAFSNSIKDIYITVEATLMKLTNNLTSASLSNYIPSSATIHYNDVDYKWQNNAWTPQS